MAKDVYYKQCRLERQEGTARVHRTTWLPVQFAVEGDSVKLKDDGVWTDGWRVVSASGDALTEGYVVHQSHAHTRQRRASDI